MATNSVAVGCVIGILALPVCANAQATDTFERLIPTLEEGQNIVITDVGGYKTTGRVVSVSASLLTVRAKDVDRTLAAAAVRRITATDSLKNGALIGLAVGAALGAALAVADNANRCQTQELFCFNFGNGVAAAGGALVGAATGVGIGIGVDAAIRPRLLYQSSVPTARASITPILHTSAQGVRVALRW